MPLSENPLETGTVAISPNSGRAGTWGTWVVTYTVGAAGIATGGGLQVALPERWHQWWRNSARRVQSVDPSCAVLRHRTHRPARRSLAMRDSRCKRRRIRKATASKRRLSAREPLRMDGIRDHDRGRAASG